MRGVVFLGEGAMELREFVSETLIAIAGGVHFALINAPQPEHDLINSAVRSVVAYLKARTEKSA